MNARGARALAAGDLEAVFLPGRGMLGASLKLRGLELLGRVADLEASAAKGSTAGIPLLHPWANRLAGSTYRAAGRDVTLDRASPLLRFDAAGLPIHGVPWSRLAWEVEAAAPDRLFARLDWDRRDLLSVFPYPHRLDMAVSIRPDGLTIGTTLTAGPEGAVPAAFGFHPYLAIPGSSRREWRLELPAMRRLLLDARGIPTGAQEPFGPLEGTLAQRGFDDGFDLASEPARFSLSGGDLRISVALLEGFPYAQVFAPSAEESVALEPMTAPTNALASGSGLRLVPPGESLRTVFRIEVDVIGR